MIRLSGERAMPKPYSIDLRGRVVEEVESGASRREAAERYGLSPSVVVIWVQRFEETGSVAAKPSGGSTSPLERHAEFLLGLIGERRFQRQQGRPRGRREEHLSAGRQDDALGLLQFHGPVRSVQSACVGDCISR